MSLKWKSKTKVLGNSLKIRLFKKKSKTKRNSVLASLKSLDFLVKILCKIKRLAFSHGRPDLGI